MSDCWLKRAGETMRSGALENRHRGLAADDMGRSGAPHRDPDEAGLVLSLTLL